MAFLAGVFFFLLVRAYFAYAGYVFSSRARDLQGKIRQLVVEPVSRPGKAEARDIGCGNGPLVIALAQRLPAALKLPFMLGHTRDDSRRQTLREILMAGGGSESIHQVS
jgi:hypothetical protein